MARRRDRYSASEKPEWSASSSAPASSVLVEKASMSVMCVGNQGTVAGATVATLSTARRARSADSTAATDASSGRPTTDTINSTRADRVFV